MFPTSCQNRPFPHSPLPRCGPPPRPVPGATYHYFPHTTPCPYHDPMPYVVWLVPHPLSSFWLVPRNSADVSFMLRLGGVPVLSSLPALTALLQRRRPPTMPACTFLLPWRWVFCLLNLLLLVPCLWCVPTGQFSAVVPSLYLLPHSPPCLQTWKRKKDAAAETFYIPDLWT